MRAILGWLLFAGACQLAVPNLVEAKGTALPRDQEECTNQAAMTARTQAGLGIMVQNCKRTFPAVRSPGGGYSYYDPQSEQWIKVTSPRLNRSDLALIERYRAKKQVDDEYNAQIRAENQREINEYIQHIEVLSYNFDCGSNATTCALGGGILRVRLKNLGDKSVRNIRLFYQIGRNISCGQSSNTFIDETVDIYPNSVADVVHNFSIGEANYRPGDTICVSIAGIGAIY